MKEEFVDFNLAKKLKEKGFNEYSDWSYSETGLANNTEIYRETDEFYCYAPTIPQVLKWLTEKHSFLNEEGACTSQYYDIWVHSDYKSRNKEKKTYEEVALAEIEYILDNLI
jgi:hypothetical protein